MSYDECLVRMKPPSAENVGIGITGASIEYTPFPDIPMNRDKPIERQHGCYKDSSQQCMRCVNSASQQNGVSRKFAFQVHGNNNFLTSDGSGDSTSSKIIRFMNTCFDTGECPPVCDYFKQDSLGPFTCTKSTSNDALPTTHDEAVTYYKKNYAPGALCAPLKENAPFQCTGSEPKSAAEILSLSYANTQLAFSAFGSIFVLILYKCKKAKDPDFLQEDELLAKLEKLEADNAAMKKAIERLEAGKA